MSLIVTAFSNTPATTLVVTISNSPPASVGQPVFINGSAEYSAPLYPVKGGTTIVTLGGDISNTYTTVNGTYSVVFGPRNAGVYTTRVCVSDSSISNCANYVFTVTAAPSSQTIYFSSLSNQLTTSRVGLAASASSGLPVSFAVGAGPATIAGGTNLTFTGTGIVSIVASQAGNSSWLAAPHVTNTFTVTAHIVLGIATPSLPGGLAMSPYAATLEATGGVPPYVWSIRSPLAVAVWGSDQYGQVAGAAGLADMTAISGGLQHALALKSDGTVVAWGYGGDGRTTIPPGLADVVKISAGGAHNLVLKSDGTAVAWGRSTEGQNVLPSGLTGLVTIAAGGFHNLALQSDGAVVAWGGNTYGATNVPAPLTGVVALAGGYYHSLALLSNGTVVAWGGQGQNPPAGLTNVVAIAAGGFHNLALKSDGTVVAWGRNVEGQRTVPPGLADVIAVSAGQYHSMALKSDGTAVAWGSDGNGQSTVPPGLAGVAAIAAGGSHSMALHAVSPLPGGLSFSTNGVLSGTPTSAAAAQVTFVVQDSAGATTNRTLDIVIQSGPPAAPVAVSATNVAATSFAANWNAVAAATNYLLDVASDTAFTSPVPGYGNLPVGNVLTWPVAGLNPAQTCYYRVRAQNGGGISESSGVITATTAKADQTIDFPAIGDQLAGNTVGLAASASSGLPVAFAVDIGPATIADGTNLTFMGDGVVSIVASQSGDAGWNPAPNVTNTFQVVTKAAATVTLENLDHLYNGTPKSATATTAPPGLAVEITYDGTLIAPTEPGSYAVTGTVNDASYAGTATGTLIIHDLAPPHNVAASPDPVHPATRAVLGWEQSQGLRVLITKAITSPVGDPTPGTVYSADDTFGNQSVLWGSTADAGPVATGLLPGQMYYFTFYAENSGHYSAGATSSVVMGSPQGRNTGGNAPEAPTDVYLGDTGAVFGCESWGVLEGNNGRVRAWISRQPDLAATGQSGPWSEPSATEHKTALLPGAFTEIGFWYWGLQVDYGAPYGDDYWYRSDSTAWFDLSPLSPPPSLLVDVKPIADPVHVAGAPSALAPHSEIELSWNSNPRGNNVMVVRRLAGSAAIGPPQGTTLPVGYPLGDGSVIYSGPGPSHVDIGLLPDTSYDYTFFSENNGYYSPGVDYRVSTAVCAPAAPVSLSAESVQEASFTARWDAVPGATGYRIDVSPHPDFAVDPVLSTVFRETMGSVAGVTTVEDHELAGGFDNIELTMIGNQAADPTDLRADAASGDYTDPAGQPASGGANVWFDATGTRGFLITGINAAGHDGLLLSFGYRKETGPNVLAIQWSTSNGADWSFIMDPPYYTGMPPENAPPGWYMVTNLPLPEAACRTNLWIRWVKSWTTAMRMDDVLLQGVDLPDPFVPGYHDLTMDNNQVAVTGLLENTTYYFRVRAEGLSGDCISANSATTSVNTITLTDTTYVSPTGSHSPPFASWATAATNIQNAVDATASGGLVLVADGVYDTGNRAVADGPPNRVVIDKHVTVKSDNGPAAAIIRGAWSGPGTSAVRAVYIGDGASLAGFTIEGGSLDTEGMGPPASHTAGAGIYAASPAHLISNCVIRNNRSFLGAGAAFANLVFCRVESNAASYGGGLYGGTADRCDVVNNTAGMEGGGALAPAAISRSRISGNIAGWAGGGLVNADNVIGCIISGNWSRRAGGALNSRLVRCTVSGNTALNFAGGMQGGSAEDSIIYHNQTSVSANYVATGLANCYTVPAPSGNFSTDPMLVSPINGHLLPGSPCVDAAGTTGLATDLDGDAVPGGAAEDIGADEFNDAATPGPLSLRLAVSAAEVLVGNNLNFNIEVEGIASGLVLDLGDGATIASQSIVTHAYSAVGTYTATATATNGAYSASASVTVHVSAADTVLHVAPGGGHVPPFTTWVNAATTIQAAVSIAPQGSTVLVSNGVYTAGGLLYPATLLTNIVIATNGILIRSVNGPTVTFIGPTNQVMARGAFLSGGSVLDGFTIRNFKSRPPGSDLTLEMAGGGVFCTSTNDVVRNCVIAGCRAETWGGGVYGGTIEDSLVISNTAGYIVTGGGGGANGSVLRRCRVAYNSATVSQNGGGLYGCTALDSVLEYNTAYDGGGAAHSDLVRCTIRGNTASYRGGGTLSGTLQSCLVARNTAVNSGGGCQFGALQSSTIVSNQAGANGGVQSVMATNSIIYGNLPNNYGSLNGNRHNCLSPLPPSGENNIDTEPQFYNASAGDYRLATNSPCINAGTNTAWMTTASDLDGNPRIQLGTADMGAYEFPSYTTNGILRAWLRDQGLPDDGTADDLDFDDDGFDSDSEWVSGTDPLATGSAFALLNTRTEASEAGLTLHWPYSVGRIYTIFWSDSPLGDSMVWQTKELAENEFAVGDGTASWTDPAPPAGNGPRIYRIGVRRD